MRSFKLMTLQSHNLRYKDDDVDDEEEVEEEHNRKRREYTD